MQTAIDTLTPGKPGFQQSDIADLKGTTVLVTGATGGIGFEVSKAFALSGARVLLLSRKAEHGEEAIQKIKEASSDPVDISFIECDLGNLQNVKDVADKIRNEEERLDILINDAGVGVNKFDVSADGIDRHFAVNYLGHYLLTNRLLPLIRRTAKDHTKPAPRIVSISSELHRTAASSVKFASPAEITEEAQDAGANALYARSKLAVLLFTKYGLVERVIRPTGARILALATHPGAVATGQQEQFKEAYGTVLGTALKAVTVPFMRTPEQGSLSTLWAATSEDVEKEALQGYYFTDPGTPGEESAQACDEGLGKNLWDVSEVLVKQKLGDDGLLPWDQEM